MITIDDLKLATNEFFETFCKPGIIDSKSTWSPKWEFKDTLPNNNKRGCYALLKNDIVDYVGLAISSSNEGSGLGARISNYWKKSPDYRLDNNVYESTVDNINGIITLPFTDDNYYLAAALEIYLITHLKGLRNKVHKRSF